MNTERTTPDTIVLIHGFWVTPRSWEDWKARYESRGYRVLTPAYPGFEVEVEALNADPTPIEELAVPAVIEHLESVVGELDAPPILMGHSAGESSRKSLWIEATAPQAWRSTRLPPRESSRCRCRRSSRRSPCSRTPPTATKRSGSPSSSGSTCSRTRSARRRRGGCTSATTSRRPVGCSGGARSRTSIPATTTRTSSPPRPGAAPFIAGSEDHLMPPKIQRSNAKHYKAEGTITEVKEFEGRAHLMPSQEGWEEVADYAPTWATEHALAWRPAGRCRGGHERPADHAHRRAYRADPRRRLEPAHRSDGR